MTSMKKTLIAMRFFMETKANDPRVTTYYNIRNDLVRKRQRTKKGTPDYRTLTARIQNLGTITDIITQRHFKEV